MLGFGASGKDLQAKWDIKDLGPENLPDGKTTVKTEKLELVAKDPEFRRNLTMATIGSTWTRAVNLRQDASTSARPAPESACTPTSRSTFLSPSPPTPSPSIRPQDPDQQAVKREPPTPGQRIVHWNRSRQLLLFDSRSPPRPRHKLPHLDRVFAPRRSFHTPLTASTPRAATWRSPHLRCRDAIARGNQLRLFPASEESFTSAAQSNATPVPPPPRLFASPREPRHVRIAVCSIFDPQICPADSIPKMHTRKMRTMAPR